MVPAQQVTEPERGEVGVSFFAPRWGNRHLASVRQLVWLVLRSDAVDGIAGQISRPGPHTDNSPMSTTTRPPKLKRRWYQFSLLTLLVVTFRPQQRHARPESVV